MYCDSTLSLYVRGLNFKYRFGYGHYYNVVRDKQVPGGIVSKAEVVNLPYCLFDPDGCYLASATDSISVLFPRLYTLLQRFHIYC